MARPAQGVEHDLRVEAYDHVQHLDLGWHESRPAGSTLATLNDDVNQLERFLDVGAPAILQTALNVLLVGAVFAAASGQLLVLAFLPIPVIVVGSFVFQRRLEPLYDRVRVAVADLSSTLSSNISGIATIKAFTAEDRERDRVAAVSQAYREANTDAIRSSAAFVPLVRLAILAGFTCTLLLGGWATLRGDLEIGLRVKDQAQAAADHRVIVGQQYAAAAHGTRSVTHVPPPGGDTTSRTPPTRTARSRIPRKPAPSRS